MSSQRKHGAGPSIHRTGGFRSFPGCSPMRSGSLWMPASEHGEWIGSFSVGPWFTVGDVAEGIYEADLSSIERTNDRTSVICRRERKAA
ncbi:hypothetical protein RHA1_ro08061 (plasmid) [Rhodococcus jostii RHA1]|uniref:Uncharacterized protein n=1 Tax=Rhodococcus jostii (strain RHA1) TaxID=101510 RepID=Q0S028_RHOJR|nr:hypothetical protein RHA1_ro08061 [Rhodococcus jostii RHA1]